MSGIGLPRNVRFGPVADISVLARIPFMLRPIINWVDRLFGDDVALDAKYALALIVSIPWLFTVLLGKPMVAVVLAAVWSVLWIGLFISRAGPWLRRLDAKWRKRRRG